MQNLDTFLEQLFHPITSSSFLSSFQSESLQKVYKIEKECKPDLDHLIHFLTSVHQDNQLIKLLQLFQEDQLFYAQNYWKQREKQLTESSVRLERCMLKLDELQLIENERDVRRQLITKIDSVLKHVDHVKQRLTESPNQLKIRLLRHNYEVTLKQLDPAIEQLMNNWKTIKESSVLLDSMVSKLDELELTEQEKNQRRQLTKMLQDKLEQIDNVREELGRTTKY